MVENALDSSTAWATGGDRSSSAVTNRRSPSSSLSGSPMSRRAALRGSAVWAGWAGSSGPRTGPDGAVEPPIAGRSRIARQSRGRGSPATGRSRCGIPRPNGLQIVAERIETAAAAVGVPPSRGVAGAQPASHRPATDPERLGDAPQSHTLPAQAHRFLKAGVSALLGVQRPLFGLGDRRFNVPLTRRAGCIVVGGRFDRDSGDPGGFVQITVMVVEHTA